MKLKGRPSVTHAKPQFVGKINSQLGTVRVDDRNNPDFWLEIEFDYEEIEALYRGYDPESNNSEDTTGTPQESNRPSVEEQGLDE